MKVGKKEISMIALVIGILAAALVYALVYNPYKEDTDAIKAECDTLRARKTQLQEWKDQMTTYEKENAAMKEEMAKLLDNYPAESRKEDAILYAARLEARNSNTVVKSLTLENPEMVYNVATDGLYITDEDKENQKDRNYSLYRQRVTIEDQFSYNGMKQFILDIVNNMDRRTIESMSITFNEDTGYLSGSTVMNVFTLAGTDKVYEEPDISGIPVGKFNLFGGTSGGTDAVVNDYEEQ